MSKSSEQSLKNYKYKNQDVEYVYIDTYKDGFRIQKTNMKPEDQVDQHFKSILDLASDIYADDVGELQDNGLFCYSDKDVYQKMLKRFKKYIEKELEKD